MLLISGHLHAEFSEKTVEKLGNNFYSLNLPSVQITHEGGEGIVMEAYDDKIVLRSRNFITNKELEEVKYKIELMPK